MQGKVRPIEEMGSLFDRLNKGQIALIRNARKQAPVKPLRAIAVPNPVMGRLQGLRFKTLPVRTQDVLWGACRVSSGSEKPLDVDCLLACYQAMSEFHTAGVAAFLECSERQARKYVQAIRIANPFMKKIYPAECETTHD